MEKANPLERLAGTRGFDWDQGNADKNWRQHQVSQAEAEQVFFGASARIAPSLARSDREPRFAALGPTAAGRMLTVVFTLRDDLIRVISARDMSRRERKLYETDTGT